MNKMSLADLQAYYNTWVAGSKTIQQIADEIYAQVGSADPTGVLAELIAAVRGEEVRTGLIHMTVLLLAYWTTTHGDVERAEVALAEIKGFSDGTANVNNVKNGRYAINNSGAIITASERAWGMSDKIPIAPDKTYTFAAYDYFTSDAWSADSATLTAATPFFFVAWYDADGNFIKMVQAAPAIRADKHYSAWTIAPNDTNYGHAGDGKYVAMYIYGRGSSDFPNIASTAKLSISEGETVYVPYLPPYTSADVHARNVLTELSAQTKKINYIHADYEGGLSANAYKSNGVYYTSKTSEFPYGQITDVPFQPCWLDVTRALPTGNVVLQIAYPYYLQRGLKPQARACSHDGSWTDWYEIGGSGSGGRTYNLINNTYTVTAYPTMQSGLPYVLESTGDATDRTADIASMLAQSRCCHLGTGAFYVKNLTMPESTSIIGSGIGRTMIYLIDDEEDTSENECYAIGVRKRCSVSDLQIRGGLSAKPSTAGYRHGISYQGTYIDRDNPGTYPDLGQISNLDIWGLSGDGILCSNTSGSARAGIKAVNINIYACNAGIEIRDHSEYHKFTNIGVTACNVGVIDASGNAMFANCGFDGTQIGFLIDNSGGDVYNDGHGSCVGCTINHTGENGDGDAIRLYGVANGYTFSGCQIHYGKVAIVNSQAIVITGCNFGYANTSLQSVAISIDGGGVVSFSGNVFRGTPRVTKTNSPVVKTDGCYEYDGTTVEI